MEYWKDGILSGKTALSTIRLFHYSSKHSQENHSLLSIGHINVITLVYALCWVVHTCVSPYTAIRFNNKWMY